MFDAYLRRPDSDLYCQRQSLRRCYNVCCLPTTSWQWSLLSKAKLKKMLQCLLLTCDVLIVVSTVKGKAEEDVTMFVAYLQRPDSGLYCQRQSWRRCCSRWTFSSWADTEKTVKHVFCQTIMSSLVCLSVWHKNTSSQYSHQGGEKMKNKRSRACVGHKRKMMLTKPGIDASSKEY